eukprot:Rhum_TRINITY_DN12707_c0_g1::Rhum_TRINITY_DN12707_c0_g1_i2::g.53826::m.53826/K10753/ASF1; histone chaperone ASF1
MATPSIALAEIELSSPNPARFTDSYEFRVLLQVHEALDSDVEFRAVWIGSSSSASHDSVLEEIEVGPLEVGANEFVFDFPAPEWQSIPAEDLLSVAVLLINVGYKEQEFLRVGYYVNVAYSDQQLNEAPPSDVIHIDKLARNVLTKRPTIVQTDIDWGTGNEDMSLDQSLDCFLQQIEKKQEEASMTISS